ncbi:MAG: isochorismatase family protein [Pararhodobacter sp.]|nr:isochorismatase family protein [Pararhodobacter sp.]
MSAPRLTLDRRTSTLVAVDLQERMIGAIAGADGVVAEAARLIAAARLLAVPVVFTEQNPAGLGPTLPVLGAEAPLAKMCFDACTEPGFPAAIAAGHTAVLMGCEAHVCVLQTALGLIARGRRVAVVGDAVGSRRFENRDAALARLARAGAQIVTAEMAIFEWLESARHPRFREVLALVK